MNHNFEPWQVAKEKTKMKSITIHNLDPVLYSNLKKIAEKQDQSLNKIIKKILASSIGLTTQSKKADFSFLSKKWSSEEHDEFTESQKFFEKIDLPDWQ
jgi:hypothetical protein